MVETENCAIDTFSMVILHDLVKWKILMKVKCFYNFRPSSFISLVERCLYCGFFAKHALKTLIHFV